MGTELNFDRFSSKWREFIARAREKGPVAVWGAGAKGVTFSLLIDPEGCDLDCVIDINPSKQGHYLGATGLPIVSPEQAAGRGIRMIVVMNPNYRAEIEKTALKLGMDPLLVCLDQI